MTSSDFLSGQSNEVCKEGGLRLRLSERQDVEKMKKWINEKILDAFSLQNWSREKMKCKIENLITMYLHCYQNFNFTFENCTHDKVEKATEKN